MILSNLVFLPSEFNSAVLGVIYVCAEEKTALAYSFLKILDVYKNNQGMTTEEALDFFYFNTDSIFKLADDPSRETDEVQYPVIVYDFNLEDIKIDIATQEGKGGQGK